MVFLNHGSFGACPRPVFEDFQNWQRTFESQPVEFFGRRFLELLEGPRIALAPEIGTAPENIVGVTNATQGLNVVAQSIPLEPGDEILTSDHEYNALNKTWTYVTQRTGAKIVVADIPLPLTSEPQFTEAVIARMTERTKVLFLSHITSPTALIFPLEKVVAEARRRGIITVIDGAHVPGHIPLDLDALGADFYSGNFHKWLMTPKGSAFLYARPEMQSMLNPLVISHGWAENSMEPGAKGAFGHSPFLDGLEVQGTRDPSAWLAIPAALEFRREHDWDEVRLACNRLAQDTAARLAAITGLEPLSAPEFSAPQMVAMPLPPCDVEQVHDALLERHAIEIPVFQWKDRHIARLSVQGYNSADDTDRLIEALGQLMDLGASRAGSQTAKAL